MSPVADLLVCLRFFSRLPVPATPGDAEREAPSLSAAAAMVPVAGWIIGLVAGLVLVASWAFGLPAPLAAALAVATLVAVTGALHEDGLADCADGFGGGRTPDDKLAIMRDSRIGTFGACAVALSLYLRAIALGIVTLRSPWLGAAVIVAVAGMSRIAALLPLLLLPPARTDGLGISAGRLEPTDILLAAALAVALAVATLPFGAGIAQVAAAVFFAAASGLAVSALAHRQIGGQTGDVAGAAQQLAEVSALLCFASASARL